MIQKLTSIIPTRSGFNRYSVAWFLGALVFMFVTLPFVEELPNGKLMEATLLTLVLATAVLAIGGRRRTLLLASGLVAPTVFTRWLHFLNLQDGTYLLHIATFLIFIAFVVFQFLRFILHSPRVNSEVLCAAVATYLLLGLVWASAFALVARLDPGAFSGVTETSRPLHGFSVIYFSLITLTTTGYGDIAPVSPPARLLAMLEAVTGTMYMAVLVARLVSVYSSTPASEREKDH